MASFKEQLGDFNEKNSTEITVADASQAFDTKANNSTTTEGATFSREFVTDKDGKLLPEGQTRDEDGNISGTGIEDDEGWTDVGQPEKPTVPTKQDGVVDEADEAVENPLYQGIQHGSVDSVRTVQYAKEAIKQQEAVENADFLDKLKAAGYTWKATYLSSLKNWATNDLPHLFGEDEEWMTKNNDARIDTLMKDNKLQGKYRPMLRDAKNQAHEDALIQEIQNSQEMDKVINDNLNNYGGMFTERTIASGITGLLGDIDTPLMLIGFGATKLAKLTHIASSTYKVGQRANTAKSLARRGDYSTFKHLEFDTGQVMKNPHSNPFETINKYGTPTIMASGHTAAGMAAYYKDPDVSGSEAAIFSTIGAVVDSLVAYRSANIPDVMEITRTASKAPDNDTLALAYNTANKRDTRTFLGKMDKEVGNVPVVRRVDGETPETPPRDVQEQVPLIMIGLREQAKEIEEVTGKATAQAKDAQKVLDEIEAIRIDEGKFTEEDLIAAYDKTQVTGAKLTESTINGDFGKVLGGKKSADTKANKKLGQMIESIYGKGSKKEIEVRTALQNGKPLPKSMNALEAFKKYISAPNFKASKGVQKFVKQLEGMPNSPMAKEILEQIEDFKALGEGLVPVNFKEFFQAIARGLDENNPLAIKTKKELIKTVDDLEASGYITSKESIAIERGLIEGHLDEVAVSIQFKANKDGVTFSPVQKDTTKPKGNFGKSKLPYVLIGLTASTMAFAGGDTIDAGGMSLLAMLALAGGALFILRPAIAKWFKQTANTAQQGVQSRGFRKSAEGIVDDAQTSFTNTFAPLMKDHSEQFRTLASKLYYDVMSGTEYTMERAKSMMFRAWDYEMLDTANIAYKEWATEQGLGFSDKVKDMFETGITQRIRFEQQVMDYIEYGKFADSPAVVRYADYLERMKKDVWDKGFEAGAKGFTEGNGLGKSYMPRFINGYMTSVLKSVDDDTFEAIVMQFSKTMDGDVEKASEYLRAIRDANQSKRQLASIPELQKYLDEQGITRVSAEEMASEFGIRDAQWGRTKARIKINKQMFGEIKINTLDGDEVTLNINDFFEGSAVTVMQRYLNQASGHIALGQKNMTIDEAMAIAEKGTGHNATVMKNDLERLVGNPILDETAPTTKLIRDLNNYTTARRMVTSVISLAFESFLVGSQLNSQGFKQAVRNITKLMGKSGKDSELMNQMMNEFGVSGQHMKGLSFGAFHHLDDANMVGGTYRDSKGGALFSKMGEMMRDVILTPLVYMSDFLSKINAMNQMGEIYKLANGKKIPQYRLDAYGITPEFLEKMKGRLELNADGALKKIDTSGWSKEDMLEFQKVIDNMTRKTIQETTMGATGAWSRNTEAGMAASMLMKFPMEAFSQHGLFGLKGMLNNDPRAYTNFFMAFAGGYVSAAIRSEMLGRDYSEEELMMYALMSMPLNIFSLIEGVNNPAGVDVFSIGENANTVTRMLN